MGRSAPALTLLPAPGSFPVESPVRARAGPTRPEPPPRRAFRTQRVPATNDSRTLSESLKARLQKDLNAARKARDKFRTRVLSTVLSDLRNREIETGEEADDDEVRSVLTRAVKQRREAAEQMRSGGRPELAEGEEAEVELLGEYLPEPLSEDQVRAMVQEAMEEGVTEMGPLMGRIMPRIRGRFEGKEANRIVREELGE